VYGYISFTNYRYQKESMERSFEREYDQLAQVYSEQLVDIEKLYEKNMLVALNAIKHEIGKKNGHEINHSLLKYLKQKYQVTHIFIINKNGTFTHSTNEHPAHIPNLFSFSQKYKNLISNTEEYFTTPIIIPYPEKTPHKFLTAWTGEYFIETGVIIDEIGNIFSSALRKNRAMIGSNIKFGSNYFTLFEKKLPSQNDYSPQKEVRVTNDKYVQTNNGSQNSYIIKFNVSRKEIVANLEELRKNAIRNFIIVLSSALISLYLILKLLGHRILKFSNEISLLSMGDKFNLKKPKNNSDIIPLAKSINQLLDRYQAESDLRIELEKEKIKTRVSNQVAHDILSPLTSLDYFIRSSNSSLKENEKIIAKQSLERIHDIINCLNSETDRISSSGKNPELVSVIIGRIIAEKRIEYKSREDVEIILDNHLDYGVFLNISKSDFSRSISNLINNSIEAKKPYSERIQILISLEKTSDNKFKISISDNGRGIAEDELNLVLEKGISLHKVNGKGLGLTYAKEVIEDHDGIFNISSQKGLGTLIKIELQIVSPPEWFQPSLKLTRDKICIIDDDESIHSIWKEILRNYEVELFHFNSQASFESWIPKVNKDEFNYLIDLEFSDTESDGIDLITKHSIQSQSIIVTSHFCGNRIQNKALTYGLKIIPKDSVPQILVHHDKQNKDIVLIDDDNLVHYTWALASESRGLKLHSFFSVDSFISSADKFDSNVRIFIDSNLGDGIKGEDESEKISHLSFWNLHLTTGFQKKDIIKPSWILNIFPKNPDVIL
jgi:signal transduction histidine kinase/FixJ family two-component response regulator